MAQNIKNPMTTLSSLKYMVTPIPNYSISFTLFVFSSFVKEKKDPVGALNGIFSNLPSTDLLG